MIRAGAVILLLAAGVALATAGPSLQRTVARATALPLDVRFNWPLAAPAPGEERIKRRRPETWLPAKVQHMLADTARADLVADPFEQGSLERARQSLLDTGWFTSIDSIRREPGGIVRVSAQWRVPAAVVSHNGREFLVARGGEVLRLPSRTPVAKGSMPVVLAPHHAPPGDALGIVYGQPWGGGDVQAGIALLERVIAMPEGKRITGVDLSLYMKTGHLTLLTDAGSKIVWGSAVNELGPGEVTFERRKARLREILAQRLDHSERRIAIYPPVVLVDKTASRE